MATGSTVPTLRLERSLLRGGAVHLACADEVGRGALSGPVSIGMVVITLQTRSAPQGVRDSKLLTPAARAALVPKVQRWATAYAVGHAGADEIDEHGIIGGLRLAGHRALSALSVRPDLVLLDGNHDYLSVPEQLALFGGHPDLLDDVPPVVTAVKGDMRCAGVAAASILAKTERDAIMTTLAAQHPEYAWAENKGYSAPEHVAALRQHGPTPLHRRSWSLPGVATPVAAGEMGEVGAPDEVGLAEAAVALGSS
ncbi:ribonuclease HII [Nocardioides jishulii]|uniref:Ribonuclease HII n=1 Tax=Nocardioides jishulii TaxID=2575440 RepID=A0A4U2YNY5_9ACTN|nr:ribonuclease HII [Nocardioides jishulii]QCX27059.1 ribonuclease HII [Nocardioides jishulii]TKI61541.1 ribonuclease HII [Nocardioides jishulii]